MKTVLTIAGFDPSGGAGVLADIKTIAAMQCYGVAAITSLTAQNTCGVYGAYHQTPEILRAQLEPLAADFEIAAVKTGMLPTRELIAETADFIKRHRLRNIVVDPVIRSTSGHDLIDDEALRALVETLFPLADLITPNIPEAERLTGKPISSEQDMEAAAKAISKMARGAAVLVKGGHLPGDESVDVLFSDGETETFFAQKISTRHTHGTGCTLSSAIAAVMAMGADVSNAVAGVKPYITMAIAKAPGLGKGSGPINHFFMFTK